MIGGRSIVSLLKILFSQSNLGTPIPRVVSDRLAERFQALGAKHVVVADRDEGGAKAVAARIGGTGAGTQRKACQQR